ncbi:sigma-70 family RNA polymerase sigma factor [Herbaspirillum rhizosphaerae]|uniref:sigma-70 family RNA polymerase sigma factor n=1 Tax=Herbaspirillum rhizosphaerae TaxID=346179 RepID=UPI00067BE66A|nr:sigma-70 family RNA polymerase sigma factor [Herbaspirillum rhizosphaerae]
MKETLTESTSLFEASRRRLLSISYRMLGSLAEAEDVVQETWLRWRDADHRTLKTPVAWLTTVATRIAIDRLRHLQRQRAAESVPWLPEPWLDRHAPSAEDAVSMLSDLSYGVLLLLERLSADERAALLLHEVFDCQYEEIAATLDKTPVHCRQLVRRARERVQSGRTRRIADQQLCERLVQDFLSAIAHQDKQAMLRLLAPDAVVIGDSAGDSIGNTPIAGLADLSVTQPARQFVGALSSLMSPASSGMQISAISINDGWGAALACHGRIVLALSFAMEEDGIATIYAVADQRKLTMLQQRTVHPAWMALPA